MDLEDQVILAVDFSAIPAADYETEVGRLCDAMEAAIPKAKQDAA